MKFLKYAAVAMGVMAIGSAGLAQQPLQKLGKGEGQVDIVAWAGYIERGATDKNFDWVTGFEKATGCKVNVKTAATSDEMVSLMAKGGYDLVTQTRQATALVGYVPDQPYLYDKLSGRELVGRQVDRHGQRRGP